MLLILLLWATPSCNKAGEKDKDSHEEPSKNPDTSKDPEDSTDPGVSTDPDVSVDPGAPLETLEVSLPTIEYTKDGDGIWRAMVTYTIITEASEVYFVWGKDAKLDEGDIIAKYKPSRMEDNGYGGYEYTIPELLPVFQSIDTKTVAVKDDRVKSVTGTLDTFKSNEHEQTIYIEADECSGHAYKDGFTLTLVKDGFLYNEGTGGYKMTAVVSAPGNWDGNKSQYTIPDGKYTVSDAKFSAMVPGAGEFSAEGSSTLEISSNKTLGTWEIVFSMDAEYDDWTQFKRVKTVVFTFSNQQMDLTQDVPPSGAFPMKGHVNFKPDESHSSATIMKRWLNSNYKVLVWGAEDTSSDSRYIDKMYIPLVIPFKFTPGEDSWSTLNGTYSTPSESTNFYSPFDATFIWLNFFQQADPSGVSYARYDRAKVESISSQASEADQLIGYLDATVQSAFPDYDSTVAKLTASDDGAWLQLEVDYKDLYTDYHVRCTTIIMTDDIIITE